MTDTELYNTIEKEYNAPFKGWDFSYLNDRMVVSPLPWSYTELIRKSIRSKEALLDMDTGGGEFLYSLENRPKITYAIEGYLPNFEIASKHLASKNVKVKFTKGDDDLPFDNDYFDIITNRHGAFKINELKRILKKGGLFITQQVGCLNAIDLNISLGANVNKLDDWCLIKNVDDFTKNGMKVVSSCENIGKYRFYDIGAVAYYLKAISWQINDFSIDKYFDRIKKINAVIEEQTFIDFLKHRFYFIAIN